MALAPGSHLPPVLCTPSAWGFPLFASYFLAALLYPFSPVKVKLSFAIEGTACCVRRHFLSKMQDDNSSNSFFNVKSR